MADPTTSPQMLRSFYSLLHLLVALARLDRSGRNGQRGDDPPYRPMRSSRHHPPREYTYFLRQKMREQMYKVLQDWRAATDPTEKMFLHSMLESIRVDLDAARAKMGGFRRGLRYPGWRRRGRRR